jgi:hypothetical protein
MATHQRQELVAQTHAEVVVPLEQRSKSPSTERARHEQWERRIEEDWQMHLETLQQCICELLIKNQRLRMELMVAADTKRK